jgi:hypothetical protein
MKLPASIRAAFQKQGKKGGQARAGKLSPARRREIAVLAARARWGKTPKKTAA